MPLPRWHTNVIFSELTHCYNGTHLFTTHRHVTQLANVIIENHLIIENKDNKREFVNRITVQL